MKLLKIVFAIVAALIGAGFASGQEIYTFFYVHGLKGILGLLLCITLFTAIIYKVLIIVHTYSIKNYNDFVFLLVGQHGFIISLIVNLFLLVTFFIMIAGFGSFFSQEAHINTYVGSGILACLCFLTFITNSDSILKVNSILVPILIYFVVLIGCKNLTSLNNSYVINILKTSSFDSFSWIKDSILYTSYNSILLIPLLVSFRKYIKSKSDIVIIALVSSLLLLLLGILIFFMLAKININISQLEMPLLYTIRNFYNSYIHIYAFVILTSIYTTAISIGLSFLENIHASSINSQKKQIVILIICLAGFSISGFGFSNLISTLYPFFGYLGITQILIFLWKSCQWGRF